MINLTLIKLFLVGFISFFATGLDDSVAYASLMKTWRDKIIISSGIITATFLDLIIAVLLAGQIQKLPYSHYIGGVGLFLLGGWVIWGKGLKPRCTSILLTEFPNKFKTEKKVGAIKLFFLGFITFFLTGLDDTLAYSLLLVTPAAYIGIISGILTATFVDLLLIFLVSEKLKKIEHSKEIGGLALMALGILIALKLI